jgi:RND family efflux transporter MFP subunit
MTKYIQSTLLLFIMALSLQSCGDAQAADPKAEQPREVRIAEAAPIDYRETITGSGRLADREEIRLSFKTGGVIRSVRADPGDQVRKGQELATLELDEIQAETRKAQLGTEKAQIDLENARLALRLAERDYRNAKGLYQDSVATLEQLENAEVQLDNAKNQLETARKGLALSKQNQEVANFNLKYSVIKAPASGTILMQLAEAGEIVGPGNPVFLLGTQASTKVLRVDVTDREIVQLQEGTRATVTFDAYPGKVFTGQIDELAAQADPRTGTYTVEIAVNTEGQNLLSGLIGKVTMEAGNSQSLLRIPIDALVRGDGARAEIFVVKERKAHLKQVQVFRIEGESLLVQEGLSASENVIISGVGYLSDGQAVQVIR